MPTKTLWKKKKQPKSLLCFPIYTHYKLCGRQVYLCVPTYTVNSYFFSTRTVARFPVIPLLFTESVTWSVVGVTLELNLANWLFPRRVLEKVFDEVILVNVLDSGDSAHLALMKRPELGVTLTKLHCWELTQFSKCVFMDADTMVSRRVSWYLFKI